MYGHINVMQRTPYFRYSGWKLQWEVQNSFKTRNMGWIMSDDLCSYYGMNVASLEEAISYCRDMGQLIRKQLRGNLPTL